MKTKYWYWIWRTFLGPSRLRKKFVRVFLLAGLIPLVLMGAVSVYLVNLTHRIDVRALENNLTRQVSAAVKKTIDEALDTISIKVTFEELAPIAFSQQDFLLEGILKDNHSLVEASFICATPSHCALGRETKRWIKTEAGLAAEENLRNLSADPSFLAAKSGKTYFGPVNFAKPSATIAVAAPVYNKNNEVIAVLAGTMKLNLIQETITNAKLGETGYVYLVNQEGVVIAHPLEKFWGKSAIALPPVKAMAEKAGAVAPPNLLYKNLDGTLVSAAYDFVPDIGWGVVAEWPRAETQSLIKTILAQVAGFSLFTLIVIAIMASWVALKLIQPIAELREGTSIIGGGNFNYRVNIKTHDELEDLGKNLNRMAENLKGLEEVHELRLRTELLSESLRKERELSRIKDQFITTVSHQLNTPLSVIKWAVEELFQPKVGKEKIRSTAETIEKSQREIVSIVGDLVTLSEIGFRYQKTKTKVTDIGNLIEKALQNLSEEIKIKNIEIEFQRPAAPATAEVNEFTMEKVFENVIDNAVGYSNQGGAVKIELEKDTKEIKVRVTDSGIGIPKSDQPSIFDQFFRAKNAIMKKNVGTGLGLFIAKTIVEGHGGKIWFASEENRGSTFYISIPR